MRPGLKLSLMVALVLIGMSKRAIAKPKLERAISENVPDIEELLQRRGWTMTPEMSAAYAQPGDIFDENNTLLKNGADCFTAEIKEGAYASMEVNRSLETGVRMQTLITGARADMGIQKKMVFDTPTYRQIPRLDLIPNTACLQSLRRVQDQRKDISGLYVITDSLSAVIQKQECGSYSAEAGGWIISGEATVQQLCEQTSLEPVAVAYKTMPVTELLKAAAIAAPGAAVLAGGVVSPALATDTVNFGQSTGSLGVEEKLKEQRCDEEAKVKGRRARQERLEAQMDVVREKARAAWKNQKRELTKCTELKRDERGACIDNVKAWLKEAREMTVSLPAQEEPVDTDCGQRHHTFAAQSATVAALEVGEAENLLERLKRPDVTPRTTHRAEREKAKKAAPSDAWKKPVKDITRKTGFITISSGLVVGLVGWMVEDKLKEDVIARKVGDDEWETRRGNINGVYVACYALLGTGLAIGGVSLAIDVDDDSTDSTSNGGLKTSSHNATVRWTGAW